MRTHPLQTWPHHRRRLAFGLVLGAALVITVLAAVASPLPANATIVDFELAGSVERTQEILAVWRREGVVDDAKAIQLFDLIYPLIYGAALAGEPPPRPGGAPPAPGSPAPASRWPGS